MEEEGRGRDGGDGLSLIRLERRLFQIEQKA
jgi:hypothetical protein